MSETLYKVLAADRTSCHGGNATWTPGEWMPAVEGELEPCANGYHLCRAGDLINWLGETIWEAEYQGERIVVDKPTDKSKVVVRQARILKPLTAWNEQTARLFACDCAERALPIIAKHAPNEERPRPGHRRRIGRRQDRRQGRRLDRRAAVANRTVVGLSDRRVTRRVTGWHGDKGRGRPRPIRKLGE